MSVCLSADMKNIILQYSMDGGGLSCPLSRPVANPLGSLALGHINPSTVGHWGIHNTETHFHFLLTFLRW